MWKPCKFILPSDPNRASHPYVLWLIGCIAQIAKALGWHQHCNRSNRKPPATLIASWYMKSQIQAKYDIFHPEVSLKKTSWKRISWSPLEKIGCPPLHWRSLTEVEVATWFHRLESDTEISRGWFPWKGETPEVHPLKWDGFEFWWDFFVADELDLKILRW